MKSRMMSRAIAFASLIATVAAWTGNSRAQDRSQEERPAPAFPRVLVQITEVKPDSVDAFVSIVRDQMIPALKKSGVPWMQTWSLKLERSVKNC